MRKARTAPSIRGAGFSPTTRRAGWSSPGSSIATSSTTPNFETTVEVTFEAQDGATVVRFEHRDLERMGADAVQLFESMDGGWGLLLDLYKSAADQP